ncbi:MAG: hypothetical protein D4R81_00750 [Nitrospiraceae bacterium]|nr:MAG: hypothetical protein D4R81_00750 [Nitrospiraceae bacterium]
MFIMMCLPLGDLYYDDRQRLYAATFSWGITLNSGERWRHYSAGLRSCQEGIIVKKAAFLGLGRPLEFRGVE